MYKTQATEVCYKKRPIQIPIHDRNMTGAGHELHGVSDVSKSPNLDYLNIYTLELDSKKCSIEI